MACRTLRRRGQAGVKSEAGIGGEEKKKERENLAVFSNLLPLPVRLAMPCTYTEAICMTRPSLPAALWKRACVCVCSQALAHCIRELMCAGRLPAGLELRQEPPK